MEAADLALVTGTTLRLTRLVVTDDLGEWWVRVPVQRWLVADPHREPMTYGGGEGTVVTTYPRQEKWGKYAEGLECPFCVGYWIGTGVLLSYYLARSSPRTLAAWRFLAGSLTLNYATAHLSSRAD